MMHIKDGLEHSSLVGEANLTRHLIFQRRTAQGFATYMPAFRLDKLVKHAVKTPAPSTAVGTRKARTVGICRPIALLE